ncbi:hypothetical protein EIN_057780 [Entamoeba invadens IP1]|uniref:hypothetical protein n=1 Tax=Entamoeba invadens IP1 TaxID=370355 RepID=UPI0002C3EDD1|nr:hypothetical protein EIN_057780 [Entamoeba invadens IP1]ELP93373.1 hypothetical protein EIN_057780 [Entamoeba invadens IP1]|eukprot:XP_004260144.1 hypothetical protein EIN_057780 [Entamoeba invadens IP1]
MKKKEQKIKVTFVISRIDYSGLSTEIDPITICYDRGKNSGVSDKVQLNTTINVKFEFISTFITKSTSQGTYKPKLITVRVVSAKSKQGELFNFSQDLSDLLIAKVQEKTVEFNYKKYKFSLHYAAVFEYGNILQHNNIGFDCKISHKKANSDATKQENTAFVKTLMLKQRNSANVFSQQKAMSSDTTPETIKYRHKSVRINLHEQETVSLPSPFNELQKDIANAAIFMQMEIETHGRNTIYTQLMFDALTKNDVFNTDNIVSNVIIQDIAKATKHDLMKFQEGLYLLSSLTRLYLMLLKEAEKSRSIPLNHFNASLKEINKELYSSVMSLMVPKLKAAVDQLFEGRCENFKPIMDEFEQLRTEFTTFELVPPLQKLVLREATRLLNLLMFNALTSKTQDLCNTQTSLQISIGLNTLLDFLKRKFGKIFEEDPFCFVSESVRVLLLNDKTILEDDEARSNVCPHLTTHCLNTLICWSHPTTSSTSASCLTSKLEAQDFKPTFYNTDLKSIFKEMEFIEFVKSSTSLTFTPFDFFAVPFVKRAYLKV